MQANDSMQLDGGSMPPRCARITSSATDVAPIFSMTRPLWTLIVPSVVPDCGSNLFVEHAGDYALEHVKLPGCEGGNSFTGLFALKAAHFLSCGHD